MSLTDNPERKVVFFLDSLALSDLVGLDGKEMLRRVGYEEEFIVSLLAKGTQFKLLVLPEAAVKLATWSNLLDIVAEAYPDWKSKIETVNSLLKERQLRSDYVVWGSNYRSAWLFRKDNQCEPLVCRRRLYSKRRGPIWARLCRYVALNAPLSEFEAFAMISFNVERA